jgi:hypothetical protein
MKQARQRMLAVQAQAWETMLLQLDELVNKSKR